MNGPDISTLSSNPQAFFAPFDAIVLVANSKDAAAALTAPSLGERPFFIFFNRVYRILDKPFRRDSLLVSRSSPVGASLVYRSQVSDAASLLEGAGFRGILNVRAREAERFSTSEEFGGHPVGFLDLAEWAMRFYPPGGRMPSTGFAMATWLAQQKLPQPIVLSGFTGVREEQWRLMDAHDWTWEQIVLGMLYKAGMLRRFAPGKAPEGWPVEALMAEFPQFTRDQLSATVVEVLANQLNGTRLVIDHVYSTLRPQLAVRRFLRWIRPRSRHVKERERLQKELAAAPAKDRPGGKA